jgi:hypothetical protein
MCAAQPDWLPTSPALFSPELADVSEVAAAEPVDNSEAVALEVEDALLPSPSPSAFSAVVRSESAWLDELVTPSIKPDAAPEATWAAAACGSCIAVRKSSADGENWLEALEGAAWAVGLCTLAPLAPCAPDAPLAGKLCPVENALVAELAEFAAEADWLDNSASRAASALEVFEVVGLITTVSVAGPCQTARTTPLSGASHAGASQAAGHRGAWAGNGEPGSRFGAPAQKSEANPVLEDEDELAVSRVSALW